MRKSFKNLEEKGKFSRSMPFFLKALFIFEEQNLKDLRITHASDNRTFQLHYDLRKISDANESNFLHDSMLIDTTYITGKVSFSKPDVDLPFDSNIRKKFTWIGGWMLQRKGVFLEKNMP